MQLNTQLGCILTISNTRDDSGPTAHVVTILLVMGFIFTRTVNTLAMFFPLRVLPSSVSPCAFLAVSLLVLIWLPLAKLLAFTLP
jgi:hypothetical protein